ncbi:peptidylprolyl isomerase [Rhodosalinus halophilus]|uniref:Parvulin-like PPIase n=1 Tax=Rhodosalinus halophilus TaxID=2259333 RepID=A0A365U4K8_9RHOB|nr:peptidylprolyl isomerase [Rhodosalinus halophilus]RBI83006.1 peptidylprolyl isomerase [Rhodosalinus halophilus]
MHTLTRPIAAALTAFALAGPAAAQDAPALDTVVATVNGDEITLGHMVAARSSLPQQYQQLPDDVLFNALLDQLVQQTLLSQTEEELSGMAEMALENERRMLGAAQAIEGIVGESVTEEALQAAYEARYADAEPGTEYNASHILVETQELAQQLIEELEGGADFAALAEEHSTGPSGPSGGSLGWFGEGAMVEPFQNAVQEMAPGTVRNEPVQTQFGWHVIRLNETRPAEAPALDEVRGELAEEIRQAAVDDRLQALRDAAQIDRSGAESLDPSALSAAGAAQE